MKSGAQLNAKDGLLEETALHKALKHDMQENVLVLVSSGASVDVADAKGDTVLHTAARRCRRIVVWAALLKGKGSNSVIECYWLNYVFRTFSTNTGTNEITGIELNVCCIWYFGSERLNFCRRNHEIQNIVQFQSLNLSGQSPRDVAARCKNSVAVAMLRQREENAALKSPRLTPRHQRDVTSSPAIARRQVLAT